MFTFDCANSSQFHFYLRLCSFLEHPLIFARCLCPISNNSDISQTWRVSAITYQLAIYFPGGGKTSVMERVTNVFCGSGSVAYMNLQSANNANATPEKPSRSAAQTINNVPAGNNKSLNNVTPSRGRIPRSRMKNVPLASGGTGGYVAPVTWEQLILDENFLGRFFLYFNATERRILAQVRALRYRNRPVSSQLPKRKHASCRRSRCSSGSGASLRPVFIGSYI